MFVVLAFLSCDREASTPIRGVSKEIQSIEVAGEKVIISYPQKAGRRGTKQNKTRRRDYKRTQ